MPKMRDAIQVDAIPALDEQLRRVRQLVVRRDVSLRALSHWRIGGYADLVVEPQSEPALTEALAIIASVEVPMLLVGSATNLLFDDLGFRGVVVRIGPALSDFRIEDGRVYAQAGIWTPHFARKVGIAGLSGAEHVIGIPGTLGGLIAMNGGSLRKNIGENLIRVHCLDREGRSVTLMQKDCGFSYRHSAILERRMVVVAAEFAFVPREAKMIRRDMIAIMEARRKKFPRHFPNCGSVFLSDSSMYASNGPPGKVIEQAGLCGLRIGDAQVAANHGNFIVNRGAADSRDVLALIRKVRTEVQHRTGYWLECEVRYISPTGADMPAHLASI
jgi:UDP-N-acetylmuramate dehydrogenase